MNRIYIERLNGRSSVDRMSHVYRLGDQTILSTRSPTVFRSPTVVPNIDNSLSKRVVSREFHIHTVPPAHEVLGMSDICDGESVVKRWAAVETKRMLVGIGEESDESRECESKVANWEWDREPVII